MIAKTDPLLVNRAVHSSVLSLVRKSPGKPQFAIVKRLTPSSRLHDSRAR
ncbi:MAG: hypothetical protein WDN46_24725 [Methylocella sp.]